MENKNASGFDKNFENGPTKYIKESSNLDKF